MTRSARWPIALALAAVDAAAVLAFARVFTDGDFAIPAIGAALLAHGVGAAARARGVGLVPTLAATIGLGFLFAAWALVPGTTWFGVPRPETVEELVRRANQGWEVFRTGRAPVPVTPGLVLLTAGLSGLVATISDALAFHRRATIGGLVPSLVLFVVASTLGTDDLRTATTIAYALAVVVFLTLQHRALHEQRRSWALGGTRSTPVLALGLTLGASALAVGLVIGPALPGVDDEPIVDYRGLGGPRQVGPGGYRTLSPIVDLQGRLTELPDTELFTVRAPLRLAWRLAALDRFDGQVWGIDSRAQAAEDLLVAPDRVDGVRQRFRIGPLDEQWLPAAYEPRAIDLDGARVITESRTLLAGRADVSGLEYEVTSQVPAEPTAEQIAATVGPVPDEHRDALELPADLPGGVRRLARAVTAGATTPHGRAASLEAFFASDGGFTYDLEGPTGSGTDAIVEFLETRRGYCEQYAGAFAAMARAVGLPSRVAVGFTPGEYDARTGTFSVRARNAHAWPEVWLTGLGWVAFEPTPPGDAPGQADPALGLPASSPGADAAGPEVATPSTAPTTMPAPAAGTDASGASAVRAGAARADAPTSAWWPRAVIAAGAALAAAAIGFVGLKVARVLRVRSRRRHAPRPADALTGAWEDALAQLSAAGRPARAPLTPAEQAAALGRHGPRPVAEHLGPLAELYAVALWSPQAPSDEDVSAAWAHADAIREALASETPRLVRWRRLVR